MAAAPRDDVDLAILDLAELRRQRVLARRRAELARLRSRQGGPTDGLAESDAELTALTDELIQRYRADLTLVDSLLDPAYPAKVNGAVGARP